MRQKFQLVIRIKLVSTLALNRMRLTGHVWFPVSDCEAMATWIFQKPDPVASTGVPGNGNYCWHVSTTVSADAMPS
jgi:hypothetical protein